MNRTWQLALACGILAACQPVPEDDVPQTGPQNAIGGLQLGEIETTADGRCFARTDPPTQTTIVNEQVLVIPEVRDANGVVTSPPVFRNITRPETVVIGQGARFETVCPQVYTAEFVETLQRALRVRGDYLGRINGILDTDTTAAIDAFQRRNGRKSNILDIAVARQLGVVATPLASFDE